MGPPGFCGSSGVVTSFILNDFGALGVGSTQGTTQGPAWFLISSAAQRNTVSERKKSKCLLVGLTFSVFVYMGKVHVKLEHGSKGETCFDKGSLCTHNWNPEC